MTKAARDLTYYSAGLGADLTVPTEKPTDEIRALVDSLAELTAVAHTLLAELTAAERQLMHDAYHHRQRKRKR